MGFSEKEFSLRELSKMRAKRTKAQYQEAVSAISMALTMVFSVGLAIEREREREGGWFEGKLWPFLWVRFEKMGRWSWGRGRVTYVDVFIMVKLQKGPLSSLLCNFLIWWKFSGLGSLLKHLTEVPSARACLSLLTLPLFPNRGWDP